MRDQGALLRIVVWLDTFAYNLGIGEYRASKQVNKCFGTSTHQSGRMKGLVF